MKIALPSRQNQVDEHFGHCEYFTVFTVDDKNAIISQDIISSPTGCGCRSNIAGTLKEIGVKLMLAGNMGQGAVNVLNSVGIKVAGRLEDSGVACALHEHGCHE
jgi:predicted Fe-Mo cluster-binding NifX family protein